MQEAGRCDRWLGAGQGGALQDDHAGFPGQATERADEEAEGAGRPDEEDERSRHACAGAEQRVHPGDTAGTTDDVGPARHPVGGRRGVGDGGKSKRGRKGRPWGGGGERGVVDEEVVGGWGEREGML